MRVPHVIPPEAFEAFRCSEETSLLPGEQGRTLITEDEHWDEANIPQELKYQALRVIADNWRDNPILDEVPSNDDRDYLLDILPLDLPLAMAIKHIPYDHYWQRAAQARWKFNDPTAHGDSWLRLYCERHLFEYLEALDPAYFEAERDECEALLKLVREHVRTLKLRQLLPHRSKRRSIRELGASNDEVEEEEKHYGTLSIDESAHVIPLDLILAWLPDLRSISINVGVVLSSGTSAEWQDFRLSVDDALKLSRGLKDLKYLGKLSITRSYLDQPTMGAILRGIAVNSSIQELDFSHCKLGDAGALAIGGFLTHRQPDSLLLVNCDIGSNGLAGIVRGILNGAEDKSTIRQLNLRLNPLGDDGAVHISALLLRFGALEYLNVSGCGFRADAGMGMAEVLASGYTKFSKLALDCSNNDLGTIVGEAFEIVTKACVAIIGLDVRMCGFGKESEYTISESVNRNKASHKKKEKAARASFDCNRVLKAADTKTTKLPSRRSSLVPPSEFAIFQHPHENRPEGSSRKENTLQPSTDGAEAIESKRFSEEEEEELEFGSTHSST